MTESTQGQKNRKNIQDTLEPKLSEFCPNSLDKMANIIAYKFHLSPYTVRYSYLPMFIDAGILELCNGNGCYDLSAKVKQSQFSQLPIEKKYEKYIQSLEKGVKKLSFDEWKESLKNE